MTAVAVQPNGSHGSQFNHRQSQPSANGQSSRASRSHNHSGSAASQISRQEAPVQNAASPMMNQRPTVSNAPTHQAKDDDTSSASDQDGGSSTMDSSSGLVHDGPSPLRRLSLQPRPTSSPGPDYSSQDESERDRLRRRPKPLLKRSKSDYGPRGEDRTSTAEEEPQDWGARHGFDDHYASEEYVSQLANVSDVCSVCTLHHQDIGMSTETNASRIGICTLQINATRRPGIQRCHSLSCKTGA
jgi:regulator-associated protein of mTOR